MLNAPTFGGWMREAAHLISDLLWPLPAGCYLCERPPGASELLCSACLQALEMPVLRCQRCGQLLRVTQPRGTTAAVCSDCKLRPPSYDGVTAIGSYDGPAGVMVRGMKFRHHTHLALPLARLLAAQIQKTGVAVTAVVPVPMHLQRLRERGFNQAELLARLVSDHLKLPLLTGVLVRNRSTRPLRELSAHERRVEVRGSFAVTKGQAVPGERLLPIDDVLTTGSTADACTMPLLAAGAQSVQIGVVARAEAPR